MAVGDKDSPFISLSLPHLPLKDCGKEMEIMASRLREFLTPRISSQIPIFLPGSLEDTVPKKNHFFHPSVFSLQT